MTGKDLERLYKFTEETGLTLLFDLNLLKRRGDGWDESNARELLEFASKRNMSNIAWELGNEPNSHHFKLKFTMEPYQLGKDFYSLRELLKEFPMYENNTVVGPDINGVIYLFHLTGG